MANHPSAKTPPPTTSPAPRRDFLILVICLLVVLGFLFRKSFLPEMVCFNNDAPLGANMATQLQLPSGFSGVWMNLNWLGVESLMPPDISMTAQWLFGPVGYAKFWIPLSCIFLGLSAWVFCRSLKFSPFACVLGGLAAALHSDPFSNACWGQVSRPWTFASMFLALAALQGGVGWRAWVRVLLAGAAVGLSIMEGFDVGALFSLVVGAFVVYQALATGEGGVVKKVFVGGVRLALVAGFAGILSAAAITSLIGTQVKGVANMEQDEATKAARWEAATQFSVPKMEILTTFFPGIFGYRINTPDGGIYWGTSGRTAEWNRYYESGKQGNPPPGSSHPVGAVGNYAGQLVLILGVWAVLQAFRRKKNSPFSDTDRKFIWFWLAVVIFCPLMMFGSYAPFYQFFYALPYASTIRNPGKFGHMFDWGIIVLSMYGAQGLCQRLVKNPIGGTRGLIAQWQTWWKTNSAFEKRWVYGSLMAVGAALIAWLIYASSVEQLKKYLIYTDFDPSMAADIAAFSIRQGGWFVLFFALALGLVALAMCGYFSAARAKFGALLLGAILVFDLGRAHQPWIKHWDWPQKYDTTLAEPTKTTNPILALLKEKAHEQRTVIVPEIFSRAFQLTPEASSYLQNFNQLYRIEWSQQQFQYYDIQSMDLVQMPRPPVEFVKWESALQPRANDEVWLFVRRWELSNTRYLVGMAGFVDLLNQQFDPEKKRFRIAEGFDLVPKPGVTRLTKLEEFTAQPNPNGIFAVIEFTGALPRAKLFTNWQVSTNEDATLRTLASRDFDPHQTVIVAAGPPPPDANTNENAGTVEITKYSPKHIELAANAVAPCILMLNERVTPNWRVTVDGQPATMLKCDYVMRGVQLAPGAHTVVFSFEPTTKFLRISLVAIAVAIALLAVLFFAPARKPDEVAAK